MNDVRRKFLVHAELTVIGSTSSEFDDAKAGRPVARRLNRMERVVIAFRGQIDQRLANGLNISFETADAALLSACEMQHRCAELPQVSKRRLALRIGIHRGLVRQRAKDSADDALDFASQLAVVEDGIVVSDLVVAEINTQINNIVSRLDNSPDGIKAFTVDWQSEITSSAFGGESAWPASNGVRPAGPYLRLHHGLKTLELTRENPVVTIGRDPKCDLVFVNSHVSRNHCQIKRRADGIILIDASVNGTCIKPDDGTETLVKNDSAVLMGKGLLIFGRPFSGERRGSVRYEAY
jgi:adenylate cyclase